MLLIYTYKKKTIVNKMTDLKRLIKMYLNLRDTIPKLTSARDHNLLWSIFVFHLAVVTAAPVDDRTLLDNEINRGVCSCCNFKTVIGEVSADCSNRNIQTVPRDISKYFTTSRTAGVLEIVKLYMSGNGLSDINGESECLFSTYSDLKDLS